MVDLQAGIIAQLLLDSKTAATMASTLPSQLQSAISGVDSSITTASESHKAYTNKINTQLTSHMTEMYHARQQQASTSDTDQNNKYDILFANLT
jgi:hypothetical protein